MITCVVGDLTEYLSVFAKNIDPLASLITKDNAHKLSSGTYYLSVADFDNYQSFVDVLESADKIIYYPPPNGWSDSTRKDVSKLREITEIALSYLYDKISIENFNVNVNNPIKNVDISLSRKTESPQLWILGASDCLGVGVNKFERYGHLLETDLQMEASYIAAIGASTQWLVSQILRADIKRNDIIILSIMPKNRSPFFKNEKLINLTIDRYVEDKNINDLFPLELLTSDFVNLYQPLISVDQLVNISQKLDITLIIAGMAPSLIFYYNQYPNYVNLSYKFGINPNTCNFLDRGKDGFHPGPKMHRWYADQILKKIKKLKP